MFKYILTPFLVFVFFSSLGQTTNNILSTKTYRAGLYMSFLEFRTNSPSIVTEVYPIPEEGGKEMEKDDPYTWFYKNKRGKEKPISNNVWGFCTGKEIYFLKKGFPTYYYLPMVFVGRYCYAVDDLNVFKRIFSALNETTESTDIKDYRASNTYDYLININNGEEFILSEKVLVTIIKDDPALYEKYQADPDGMEKRIEYILNYNRKHQDQIKDIK